MESGIEMAGNENKIHLVPSSPILLSSKNFTQKQFQMIFPFE